MPPSAVAAIGTLTPRAAFAPCTCAPWELRDNQDQEEAEDRAESVRIGYVAATRAKDLLIVSAWHGPVGRRVGSRPSMAPSTPKRTGGARPKTTRI